jgi:hypothetical protein
MATLVPARAADTEQLIAHSRTAVKAYFQQLKGALVTSLKKDGSLKTIEVCKLKAPEIAQTLGQENGMKLGRTSLKYRNPDNKPDEWEKAVLEQFEQRKTAGEEVKQMEFSEIVEQDGKQTFRYMKAIPTKAKPCLACHGRNIEPDVAAEIDRHYPEDQARDYKSGDIRGAFSFSKEL